MPNPQDMQQQQQQQQPQSPQQAQQQMMQQRMQQQAQQQFTQRLQQRLNPRIGTMQDSDPQQMAQFMVKYDPDKSAAMLAKMLMMIRGGGQIGGQ